LDDKIRFCTTPDGVRIAYASVGSGPPLVKAAHWLTHVQYDLESPVWRPWVREFSKQYTYIRYDERGFGLSDRDPENFSFESWVQDLETVVDALGLEKFDLLGNSQGGPVSIAYAARHPERVNHLVLGGAFAKGWEHWNIEPGQLELIRAMVTIMKNGWGRDDPFARRVFTDAFLPESTPEQQRWFDDLQRVSCTPETAFRLMTEVGNLNIEDLLPRLTIPTLVLHSKGDIVIPFERGREMAGRIPNSRFVPMEGRNHILLPGEPAWQRFLSETHGFIGVRESPDLLAETGDTDEVSGLDRRLAAIMYTDIVGYTALTGQNESLALSLLEEHRKLLRPLFTSHNGREVKTVGDMFLVEFPSGLEAVKCAIRIQTLLSKRNETLPRDRRVSVRVGVHVGDVEHRQGDVYGDAVNVASRIEPLADPNGILITKPVYEQVRSRPEIKTESIGSRELKNVKEPIELFRILP
jgi:class 3 adenylate cyclase/pimeloyl-ACP methyl ester carboxylesterase